MTVVAIIVAGGNGKRMGRPKQFLEIGGRPILEHTVAAFNSHPAINSIILVVAPDDVPKAQKFKFAKLKSIIPGGPERQDSVFNGIKALPEETELVVIHDGARPFVSAESIMLSVAGAKEFGAVVIGVPVKDTIKQITNDKLQMTNGCKTIDRTLDRKGLWSAQTPQAFKKDVITTAYQEGIDEGLVTDDAMLVEKLGIPVKMIMGSYGNIKVTTPEDLFLARSMFRKEGRK
ncbi:MAG: 2-C-methyl-D-erythritol 4-phosphate cytidylyltransferase [bacterium]